MRKPDLTLVLPCYNEETHIKDSIKRIVEILDLARFSYEIILIDDKSKDKTLELVKKIAKEHKNIKVFAHKKNIGRGGTVKEGILKARSDFVGFIDVDLEIAPDYIPHFVNKLKEGVADIVVAHRYYPFHIFPPIYPLRVFLSRGYIFLVRRMLNLPFHDTEAGYKFFNREKTVPIIKRAQNNHWFFDTEIIARSYLAGLRIVEIPTLFLRRSDKKSSVKIVPDSITYFKEIFRFKRLLRKEFSPPGILYNHPFAYKLAMKLLFGRDYSDRYKKVANLVSAGSSLVDVCCGDSQLYTFLVKKNISYLGLDISPAFVAFGRKRGINIRLADVERDEIPQADYVVMQGSLFQFKNPGKIVSKLHKSAKKALIISESINNLETKPYVSKTLLSYFSTKLVGTRNRNPHFRFDEKSFRKLLSTYDPKFIRAGGGKDLIAVIKKNKFTKGSQK